MPRRGDVCGPGMPIDGRSDRPLDPSASEPNPNRRTAASEPTLSNPPISPELALVDPALRRTAPLGGRERQEADVIDNGNAYSNGNGNGPATVAELVAPSAPVLEEAPVEASPETAALPGRPAQPRPARRARAGTCWQRTLGRGDRDRARLARRGHGRGGAHPAGGSSARARARARASSRPLRDSGRRARGRADRGRAVRGCCDVRAGARARVPARVACARAAPAARGRSHSGARL